jgi:hypothetical protein
MVVKYRYFMHNDHEYQCLMKGVCLKALLRDFCRKYRVEDCNTHYLIYRSDDNNISCLAWVATKKTWPKNISDYADYIKSLIKKYDANKL